MTYLIVIGGWIIVGLAIWFVLVEIKKTSTFKLIKGLFK